MLALMASFMIGYLPMLASALTTLGTLHAAGPALLLSVAVVVHHLVRLSVGEWHSYGEWRGITVNMLANTLLPLVVLVCPLPTVRDLPSYTRTLIEVFAQFGANLE